ncbi:hypothetical protein DPMN_099335 [Dreissena polymorpha]|uniref:Cysteine and tyrosine-rich protein 1 n=1 Tax=Dreissena polymorpha TaxID=45954 RepID=A0A9D4R7J8_DREPO|nr:hypothetical protein DPMN_099335 [Dreissena polymorpha]
MSMYTLQRVLVLAFGIYEVSAGTWCRTQSSLTPTYCSLGCCTVNGRTRCCEDINIGVLVGSIVGGLIGLIVLVSIIVVCCCIMNRNRARQGQFLATTNSPPGYGTPGTQMGYVQQPYQAYPMQTNNMTSGYMTTPTQPTAPWQPPPYEEANKG